MVTSAKGFRMPVAVQLSRVRGSATEVPYASKQSASLLRCGDVRLLIAGCMPFSLPLGTAQQTLVYLVTLIRR